LLSRKYRQTTSSEKEKVSTHSVLYYLREFKSGKQKKKLTSTHMNGEELVVAILLFF
jgi:hypothetical protein